MNATRARPEDLRARARSERFAASLWPLPTIFGFVALVIAVLLVVIDDQLHIQGGGDRLLVADPDTALALTSVVATGMLAFLGIVFATTLVAIQLAASQYSPRAVRVFVRSRLTKVALGVFVATFVFSLVTLIAIRTADAADAGFTPVLSTGGLTVLVIATLVAFLVFANGTAQLLRVQYLIERIARDTRPGLEVAFPSRAEVVDAALPDGTLIDEAIGSLRRGVLDAVDVGGLAALAEQVDGWIEMTVPVGSYVPHGGTIAIVHRGANPSPVTAADLAARVDACLLFTNERTLLQDPGFGFRQLVDIASRALSPAVNDPTTAVQVVDRLTDLLGQIVDRNDPSGWFSGVSNIARVHLELDDLRGLTTLAFTEVIRYGVDSPQVVRRLHSAFDQLDARAASAGRVGIEEMRRLLAAATDESAPSAFLEISAVPDPRGLG